jgi:hypothetical protein
MFYSSETEDSRNLDDDSEENSNSDFNAGTVIDFQDRDDLLMVVENDGSVPYP